MRSQFSNRQKLDSIKQELANYVQKIKSENDRLFKLISQDQFFFAKHDYDSFREQYFKDDKIIIRRQELSVFFSTNYNSPNSVCLWINRMIGLGILSLNPTSSITKKGFYKPTPDTHYFINEEKLIAIHRPLSEFG